MRRFATIAIVAVAGYVLWTLWMTRSTTITLEPSGYKLTYTMAWGWGMDEKISFSRLGELFGYSSEWVPIFDKPYNSGVSLYRSAEGDTYFLSAGLRFFKFEASSGNLTSYCHSDMLTYTRLGKQLSMTTSYSDHQAIDPGTRGLFEYIEPDQQSGMVPTSPPDSRYYANLKYLGKFGLVRSGGRGNEVRFAPANDAPEPRLGLFANCG